MRLILLPMLLLVLFASGCDDDSSSPTRTTTPTTYEIVATTNWFITSPDVDLSRFSSVHIVATFQSDVANDLTFNDSPQFQLWSDPDVYDFVQEGAVTINAEPSGSVSPGNTFSYDLTVDLSGIPANQKHIAIRPTDDNLYGTLGPSKISVFSSEVKFTP